MLIQMKKFKGFTLIELMIVVAIIGILAAVAIPAYTDYLKRSKVGEAVNLMGGLKTPIEEYIGSENKWPSSLDGQIGGKTSGRYTSQVLILSTDEDLSADDKGLYAVMRDNMGSVGMAYHSTKEMWGCTLSTDYITGTAVKTSLVPSNCRNTAPIWP